MTRHQAASLIIQKQVILIFTYTGENTNPLFPDLYTVVTMKKQVILLSGLES